MTTSKFLAASILVLGLSFSASLSASQAASTTHEGHQASELALTLNAGVKWQGDENMLKGMNGIRAALAPRIPAIHNQTLPASEYEALAADIQSQVDFMITNCKLAPEVDEQFHMVLGEVLDGVTELQAEPSRQTGAVRIVTALNAYGDHFAHPGWQPLE
jgi:hypothetical protein